MVAIFCTKERFRAIDVLRGVAILGVISVHSSLTLPTNFSTINSVLSFGAYGVQLFFLLSAITMCMMWEKRQGEQFPIRKFYIRRICRIAPLFWLAIPVYLFINGVNPSYWAPYGIHENQIILTALFLHGLTPDAINSVVPGGWSIAVEMTFYLIFPLLILSFKRNARAYLLTAVCIWCINILLVKPLIADDLIGHHHFSNQLITDYLNLYFPNQAPVFLVGCWIYFSLAKKLSKVDCLLFIFWIAVALIFKFAFSINGLGFLLIFLFLAAFTRICLNYHIHFKPLEMLGRNSYAIYLVHFLVISFVYRLLPNHSGVLALIGAISLTTVMSYAISYVTNISIEGPFQNLASKITDRG